MQKCVSCIGQPIHFNVLPYAHLSPKETLDSFWATNLGRILTVHFTAIGTQFCCVTIAAELHGVWGAIKKKCSQIRVLPWFWIAQILPKIFKPPYVNGTFYCINIRDWCWILDKNGKYPHLWQAFEVRCTWKGFAQHTHKEKKAHKAHCDPAQHF